MKKFSHIISHLFYEPLLITPQRHAALCQFVEARLAGGMSGAADVTVEAQPARAAAGDDDVGGQPAEERSEPVRIDKTVIIPVHGTLVAHPEDIAMSECGCSMEDLNEMIETAERDPQVTRMIFDFRTPGGTVTGIPETGRKILNSSKETVAFTDSECCSGGIWLAAQCDRFYATQSSRVGSVGVYVMGWDMTGRMRKAGVKVNAVSAGKYKLLGAYWKPMGDDERALLQNRVDKIYAQFTDALESQRVVNDEHFGNGLVFDGEEAAHIGFTDGVVEGIDDIIERMVE